MELNNAIKKMVTVKKGAFTPITYRTELPIKAKYKTNFKVVKESHGMGRFGIFYGNIASVKERAASAPVKGNDNEVWILKNTIKYNKNTKKFYLVVYTANATNAKIKSVYKVVDTTTGAEVLVTNNKFDLEEYVIASYFKPNNGSKVELFSVNLDNVISVGK